LGKALQRYRKLFESVKKDVVHPLYFLYGPEEYLKKEFIRELLEAALPEANRAFNLDVLYGDEFDRHMFDDRVGSFPLFSERRMVILRNFRSLTTSNKEHVIGASQNMAESVVLVVETTSSSLDTAPLKNMKKAADEHGLSFKFEFLDEEETIERVRARFRREGRDVEPDALDLLVESVGTQLIDLINEVEKICLAAGDDEVVGRELVASVVGKYRNESLFSLLDALEEKDPAGMIRKLNRLLQGGEEPVVLLGMLLKRVVLLLEVKALTADGGRRGSTARDLASSMSGGASPYYAEILRRQSRQFERSELVGLLENLRWADFKLKTTQLEARHILEEALLSAHLGKTLAYAENSL